MGQPLLQAMNAAARNIVSLIQGTASVTDAMEIAAGVTIRKTHGTPVHAPSQKPFVTVDERNVKIELRQDSGKLLPGVSRYRPLLVA